MNILIQWLTLVQSNGWGYLIYKLTIQSWGTFDGSIFWKKWCVVKIFQILNILGHLVLLFMRYLLVQIYILVNNNSQAQRLGDMWSKTIVVGKNDKYPDDEFEFEKWFPEQTTTARHLGTYNPLFYLYSATVLVKQMKQRSKAPMR